ncbi:MAG: hypothetical protein NTV02_00065 [Candidatus Zambryskibacteria bacterium]|nr:hypothetical protein [Candidatus Zambryskibacteria bacterium]
MMYDNIHKKEKAIMLRKEGKTYSEILKQVFVAKSTLTEWFREVKLTTPQVQKLTQKKLEAAMRGGAAKRAQRVLRTQIIRDEALGDITSISKRELWLIGIVLYWAEGTKEKDFHPGASLTFNNSDPRMIKIYITWLLESCGVSKERIHCDLYIHENSKNSINDAKKHWSKVTCFPVEKFKKVCFKTNKIKTTNRRNTGTLYYGLLRVKVSASSTLLRRVAGWTEAIVKNIE